MNLKRISRVRVRASVIAHADYANRSPPSKPMPRCSEARRRIPEFRLLKDEDMPELQRMVLALYREDPPGQPMSVRKIWHTIAELSAHPDKGAITIMHVGDAIVGYAIVIYYWSNEYGGNIAHIDEFYVKPSWRNKGIGSSYVEHIAKIRGINLKGIHVETTPANQEASAFYLRRGFKLAKNRHMFRKLP
jgi:GNAT superfamily N-acetyltransferase